MSRGKRANNPDLEIEEKRRKTSLNAEPSILISEDFPDISDSQVVRMIDAAVENMVDLDEKKTQIIAIDPNEYRGTFKF